MVRFLLYVICMCEYEHLFFHQYAIFMPYKNYTQICHPKISDCLKIIRIILDFSLYLASVWFFFFFDFSLFCCCLVLFFFFGPLVFIDNMHCSFSDFVLFRLILWDTWFHDQWWNSRIPDMVLERKMASTELTLYFNYYGMAV